MPTIIKANIKNIEHNIASTAYCTCTTAKDTVEKVAYIQGNSGDVFNLI